MNPDQSDMGPYCLQYGYLKTQADGGGGVSDDKSHHWWISLGSDISYFHKQTEQTLIRQLSQELSDLGLLCLQRR